MRFTLSGPDDGQIILTDNWQPGHWYGATLQLCDLHGLDLEGVDRINSKGGLTGDGICPTFFTSQERTVLFTLLSSKALTHCAHKKGGSCPPFF